MSPRGGPGPGKGRRAHDPAWLADLATVKELVWRTGQERLRFTVSDVRHELERTPGVRLVNSDRLHQLVAALEGITIVCVGKRLGVSGSENRARHCYVLRDRLAEFERSPLALEDLERVYTALWVAVRVHEQSAVPTRLVTTVCSAVPALRPSPNRQMYNVLAQLAAHTPQMAERVPGEGRWNAWRPLGEPLPDAAIQEFIDLYQATRGYSSAAVAAGYATRNELLRELVEHVAGTVMRSPAWRSGRSVQYADLLSAKERDGRTRKLIETIEADGVSLSAALKSSVQCGKRLASDVPRVVMLPRVGGRPYYDVSPSKNLERRRLVVEFDELKALASVQALDELRRERASATAFVERARTDAARAVGALRSYAHRRRVDDLVDLCEKLLQQRFAMSKQVRQAVEERATRVVAYAAQLAEPEVVRGQAVLALRRYDLEPDLVLAAPRPFLSANELAEWVSPRALLGRTAAEYLGTLPSLRRYSAEQAGRQERETSPSVDARRPLERRGHAIVFVDRVEALTTLAERTTARTVGFLRSGAAALGPNVRSPDIGLLLARSMDRDERIAGLAALVLLGAPAAPLIAMQWLSEPERTQDELFAAVYALVVSRVYDDGAVRGRLGERATALRPLLQQVRIAVQQNRMVLQR